MNLIWRYLAVIMDKFPRPIVGWSLSNRRNVDLSLRAFKRVAKKRLVQSGLYFHSDRGGGVCGNKISPLAARQWRHPKHEPQGHDE